MPAEERASLIRLRKTTAPQVSPEVEAQVLHDVPPAPQQGREDTNKIAAVKQKAVRHTADVHLTDIPTPTGAVLRAQPGKNKGEPTTLASYRLPNHLLAKLKSVAEYNHLTMRDIVEDALEVHLPHFPQPPGES